MRPVSTISISTKIAIGFAVPLVLMIVISISTYLVTKSLIESNKWVVHTQEAISRGQLLLKLIVDMETGERGFLITGKEHFLEPYYLGRKQWETSINDLKNWVSDNPQQVALLIEIDEDARKWIQLAANPEIAMRRKMNRRGATMKDVAELIEKETGKALIDKLREDVASFVSVEKALIDIRTTKANDAIAFSFYVTLFGTLASVFLAFITVLYLLKTIFSSLKELGGATNRIASGDLSTPVPVRSQDELGDMAIAFNQMMSQLLQTRASMQNHQKELEEQVNERTLHLELANKELERLSQIDGLTNIYNRRYLDEYLGKRWREHTRNGLPLSMMMIDIDYFKKFNDTYGHQAGDDCICIIAHALQDTLKRPTDILARYGGEEFCVVVSGDADDTMEIADLLCQAIATLQIENKHSEKGFISISVGVNSIIPSQYDNLAEFIEQADQALYASKQAGRDQVTLHKA